MVNYKGTVDKIKENVYQWNISNGDGRVYLQSMGYPSKKECSISLAKRMLDLIHPGMKLSEKIEMAIYVSQFTEDQGVLPIKAEILRAWRDEAKALEPVEEPEPEEKTEVVI